MSSNSLISVLRLSVWHCLQIMCAKYYELRFMFWKIAPRQSWCVFAWYSVKIRVIFVVRF